MSSQFLQHLAGLDAMHSHKTIIRAAQHMCAIFGEAYSGDSLCMRTLVLAQTLPRPHLPHLCMSPAVRMQHWLLQAFCSKLRCCQHLQLQLAHTKSQCPPHQAGFHTARPAALHCSERGILATTSLISIPCHRCKHAVLPPL